MTRYYIIDLIADDSDDIIYETNEKDFYDQMEDNYQIAKEEGDKVPAHKKMMSEFQREDNHEEAFNAFSFLKLTDMTPQEWGY